MQRTILWSGPLASCLLGAAAMLGAGPALATAPRAFVSTTGADTNSSLNCGPTTPCRTFAAALSVVAAGGEVVVLTSGGYGTIAITQSVSIDVAPGVYAGIAVATGTGISVNAPGSYVFLRGLTISGQPGTTGISVGAGTQVVAEKLTIQDVAVGVQIDTGGLTLGDSFIGPTSSDCIQASSPTNTSVSNVTVYGSHLFNCGGDAINQNLGTLEVYGSSLYGQVAGISLVSGDHADIQDSSVHANGGPGVSATCTSLSTNVFKLHLTNLAVFAGQNSTTSGVVNLPSSACSMNASISHLTIDGGRAGSSIGVYASGAGTAVWLGDTQIANVQTGIDNVTANVYSFGTNSVEVTGPPASGTITSVARL